MNNIFTDKNLYPHKGKIKSHFGSCFDSVFVAFVPFFVIDNGDKEIQNFQQSIEIPLEQAKEKVAELKELDAEVERVIFAPNENYPSQDEIIKSGTSILWAKIILEAGFKNKSELCQALKTSIGAYSKSFSMPELAEKLNRFTKKQKIWHPKEGCFDFISSASIFKMLKLLDKNEVVTADEFYETNKFLNLNHLNEVLFFEEVSGHILYIYSADKEILFAIEWDSFFFLIATDKTKMDKLISSGLFEGFLCNHDTEHSWE